MIHRRSRSRLRMRPFARPYALIGLLADVLRVVDQTFHPTNAGMWLRGESR